MMIPVWRRSVFAPPPTAAAARTAGRAGGRSDRSAAAGEPSRAAAGGRPGGGRPGALCPILRRWCLACEPDGPVRCYCKRLLHPAGMCSNCGGTVPGVGPSRIPRSGCETRGDRAGSKRSTAHQQAAECACRCHRCPCRNGRVNGRRRAPAGWGTEQRQQQPVVVQMAGEGTLTPAPVLNFAAD